MSPRFGDYEYEVACPRLGCDNDAVRVTTYFGAARAYVEDCDCGGAYADDERAAILAQVEAENEREHDRRTQRNAETT